MIRNYLIADVASPDAENTLFVPDPTWRLRVSRVSNIDFFVSFKTGHVAAGNGIALTAENPVYDTSWLYAPSGPLYFTAPQPGARLKVEVWTENAVHAGYPYDEGFDLGFES